MISSVARSTARSTATRLAGLQGDVGRWTARGEAVRQSGKATGDPAEIERYLRVFGDAGRVRMPVYV
jgi:hypothetical protein